MVEFASFVGGVLPYAAAVTFVVGMAYRFYVWFSTPQPAKITLYPWPEGSMATASLSTTSANRWLAASPRT